VRRRTSLWAGAGLGVLSVNPPGGAAGDIDVGLNLLFGVRFRGRPVVPYFQAKLIAKEDPELSLAFGLRF
jgi:hypothetical protein